MAICSECEAVIDFDEFNDYRGDQLSCPECGENLEIVSVSPFKLDAVSNNDDDYEDRTNIGDLSLTEDDDNEDY